MSAARTGPVSPTLAGLAPVGALAVMVVGVVAGGFGVWAIAAGALLLALCCLGVVAVHEAPTPRLLLGGWASAFSFAVIAVAQVAVGLVDRAEVEVDASDPVAMLPGMLVATGVVTLPIANGMLAWASGRAHRLPTWGSAALWAVTPLLPATLLVAARAGGAVIPAGVALLLMGWVVVGLAVRAADQ